MFYSANTLIKPTQSTHQTERALIIISPTSVPKQSDTQNTIEPTLQSELVNNIRLLEAKLVRAQQAKTSLWKELQSAQNINNQMDTVLKRAGIQRTETLLFTVQNKKLSDDIKPLTGTQVITLSETGVLPQNPADTDLQAQDTPMDQSPHLTHEETLLEKIRALEEELKQSQGDKV